MDLMESLSNVGEFLDGEDMTGRQAGAVIAFWMGFTAFFGLAVFVVVFVIMGV